MIHILYGILQLLEKRNHEFCREIDGARIERIERGNPEPEK